MDQKMMMGMNDDQNQEINLPPGFRFHPTDEELITYYLCRKVADGSFVAVAIGEADLNKCEPWDLPGKAKMGENEWYFFYLRDKKYPTGLRTNRATDAGYWKATGKDKEIFRGKALVGMKKTLVFYRGRAPKGEKSNWVMHEYRVEGKLSLDNLPKSAKTDWVISRVFEKSSNGIGKKVHVPGVPKMASFEDFGDHTQLPPLMDFSQSCDNKFKNSPGNVSCFSNQTEFPRAQDDMINPYSNNNHLFSTISQNQPSNSFPKLGQSSPLFFPGSYQFSNSIPIQDQAMMRAYLDNTSWNQTQFKSGTEMVSVSQETGLTTDMNCNMNNNNNEISSLMSSFDMGQRPFEDGSSSGGGLVDLENLWLY